MCTILIRFPTAPVAHRGILCSDCSHFARFLRLNFHLIKVSPDGGNMFNIKFLNEENVKKGNVKKINSNVVEITGLEQNLSGFQLLTKTGDVWGKYEDYTTLYRVIEGGFQLSNDGSVYVEPEPEPEPVEPTLEELKQQKINEVSNICKETIYAGVDVELPTGTTEHFSLKEEDQINLFGKQAQITAGVTQLEYHQDGHPCRYYTVEEMTAIITAAMQYVSYHTTYCNSLYTWINAVEDKGNLGQITYGSVIPVEYQSEVLQTYLMKMSGTSV
jgi:hypothetical protein